MDSDPWSSGLRGASFFTSFIWVLQDVHKNFMLSFQGIHYFCCDVLERNIGGRTAGTVGNSSSITLFGHRGIKWDWAQQRDIQFGFTRRKQGLYFFGVGAVVAAHVFDIPDNGRWGLLKCLATSLRRCLCRWCVQRIRGIYPRGLGSNCPHFNLRSTSTTRCDC